MGFPASGAACSQNHAAMCGSCYPGYDVSTETKECVMKECTCVDGTPVAAKDCPKQGTHKCGKCRLGFHVDKDGHCKINQCTCKAGLAAVGDNCPKDNSEYCASCNAGLYLHNGGCSSAKTCQCPNGTAVPDSKCTTNYATICQKCDSGFTLYHSQCVANRCVCENGVASAICSAQGGSVCEKCDNGYHLDDGKCVPRQCKCGHGTGAVGTQCASDGAHSCAECFAGYHQKLHTVQDTEQALTRLAITCEPNKCTCQSADGKLIGRAADGEYQSQCHADKATVCVKCNSHYQGPNNKHECVANACICADGTPVDVQDCHVNNQHNCKECYAGFWLSANSSWTQDKHYQGTFAKSQYKTIWDEGGAVCLPHAITSVKPFDCHAGQNNWELAWSAMKQHWCCMNEKIGCVPTETAKSSCEGKGFTQNECDSVGCCSFVAGECKAKSGWADDVCKPDFKIISMEAGTCMKGIVADKTKPDKMSLLLETCLKSDVQQAWRPNEIGQIHDGSGRCLAVSNKAAGERVVVVKCVKTANSNNFDKQNFVYKQSMKELQLTTTNPGSDFCASTVGTSADCQAPKKCVYLAVCDSSKVSNEWLVSVVPA